MADSISRQDPHKFICVFLLDGQTGPAKSQTGVSGAHTQREKGDNNGRMEQGYVHSIDAINLSRRSDTLLQNSLTVRHRPEWVVIT